MSLVWAHADFPGAAADDRSGCAVSSAGDVDGDGIGDIFIGAEMAQEGDARGAAYVVFATTALVVGTHELSSADAVFTGEQSSDFAGSAVADAGDVDGDGLGDLLIGAYGNGEAGALAGKTYLMFGASVQPGDSYSLQPPTRRYSERRARTEVVQRWQRPGMWTATARTTS